MSQGGNIILAAVFAALYVTNLKVSRYTRATVTVLIAVKRPGRLSYHSGISARRGTLQRSNATILIHGRERRRRCAEFVSRLLQPRIRRRNWQSQRFTIYAGSLDDPAPFRPAARYRISSCSGFRKGFKQIAGPRIAAGAVFPHARHELWTPMLARRNESRTGRMGVCHIAQPRGFGGAASQPNAMPSPRRNRPSIRR
jgi:hypothetical protein